jgi:hypothetical protein
VARGTDTPDVFELLRFSAVAAGTDALLLELEGRWSGDTPARGRARLLVEGARGPFELAPVAGGEEAGAWRASFALPADAIGAPLAIAAHGLVVDLPAPDPTDDATERLARVAREANAVRRRLERAEGIAATAVALAAERDRVTAEREQAIAERDALRAELEAAAQGSQRLQAAHAQREAELQAERDRVRADAEEREAALRTEHEQQLAAAAALVEQARAQAAEREAALGAELEEARRAAEAELQRERAAAREALDEAREEHAAAAAAAARALERERAGALERQAALSGELEVARSAAADRDALREELDRAHAAEGDGGEDGAALESVRRERDGLRAALDATRGELAAEREHLTTLRADYARLERELEEAGHGDPPTRPEPVLWRDGGDDETTRVAPRQEPPLAGSAGEPGDEPTQSPAAVEDDPETFETDPIVPRTRAPGAPRQPVGPAPSAHVARMIAVGVLAVALLIVLLLVVGALR